MRRVGRNRNVEKKENAVKQSRKNNTRPRLEIIRCRGVYTVTITR